MGQRKKDTDRGEEDKERDTLAGRKKTSLRERQGLLLYSINLTGAG